ncbi:hypothetical protein EVAR_91189_1 [Eumeta japonica]|uniref:Uncharacterized protein n=1 Tax=Eumeta variegata TaxID=151549 RepID=A0A4C1ZKD4_EUMVA|nr:hypothetical protein EVAR_91189_1 [Eumeta japonica]
MVDLTQFEAHKTECVTWSNAMLTRFKKRPLNLGFQNIFKKSDKVTGDLHGAVKRKYEKPLRRRRSDRNPGHPLPAVVRQHWRSAHVALD